MNKVQNAWKKGREEKLEPIKLNEFAFKLAEFTFGSIFRAKELVIVKFTCSTLIFFCFALLCYVSFIVCCVS